MIHGPLWLGLAGVALMLAMSASYYLICLWLLTRPGALALYARSERYITAGEGERLGVRDIGEEAGAISAVGRTRTEPRQIR